jgi:Raf kinase inhibitor-like YbhB/YbcL family protein
LAAVVAAVSALALSLTSPAFDAGSPIPQRYTCDGVDRSPPLRWSQVPRRARGLALEVDDPDAPGGVFTHWLVWNLPVTKTRIPSGVAWRFQGRNSFGRVGYSGPCPPAGSKHHYVFTLFAVDRKLSLARGAAKPAFRRALGGHVVARARLVGTYQR